MMIYIVIVKIPAPNKNRPNRPHGSKMTLQQQQIRKNLSHSTWTEWTVETLPKCEEYFVLGEDFD